MKLKIENAIGHLFLSSPKTGNAFSLVEAQALAELLPQLKTLRTVIFSSEGERFFCSGGQLKAYAKLTKKSAGLRVNYQISKVLKSFSQLPVPTIALVNGDCFGGGLEVLSTFDYVVSAPHSYLGFWQRRIGLSFGWGGGARWSQKIGQKEVLRLTLQGRSLCAYEALRLGLIDEVCSKHQLERRGQDLAEQLSQWSKIPVPGLKKYTPKKEQKLFDSLWWNKDHKKILHNFRS